MSKLKLCIVFSALSAFMAGQALATGTPTPPPAPTPPSTSTSSAESAAAAAAAAKAQAGAAASAQGGNARQGQGQQQGQQMGQGQRQSSSSGASITGGSESSSSENNLYVLPAPVFTPPMAAVQCPVGVEITNEAFSILVASAARGHTDNSDCVLIQLRNDYVAQCQYYSAKQVMDMHTRKKLPGFTPTSNNYYDLTPGECRALNAPPVVAPAAPTHVTYNLITQAPAEVKAPEVVPVAKKKRVRTAVPCERVQVEKKVWQCKKP